MIDDIKTLDLSVKKGVAVNLIKVASILNVIECFYWHEAIFETILLSHD